MTVAYQHFGIIGAGAWGTALAATLCRAGRDVTVWSHNPANVSDINGAHENKRHLPGLILNQKIKATGDFADIAKADVLLFATPAQHLRRIARELAAVKNIRADVPVIIAAKGIELHSSKFMSEILEEEMPKRATAILSGPSFAIEVAAGMPTALTLAVKDKMLGEKLAESLATPSFRPYLTDDIVGAQLGGAIKNVLAIACGIVTGRELGENARAALITRGLAEMMRLGQSLGAKSETLMGLSGLGDVLLTCSSAQSRNMSLGIELGEGQTLDAILQRRTSVAEGVPTAEAARSLAEKRKIDMPVVASVAAVLAGTVSIDRAIADLLSRPLKTEMY